MSVFTTLMVLILVASAIICLVTISRVFAYNRKYHLPELSYTKLFRIITKEYAVILYALFVAAYIVFTIWFLFTL